MNTIPTNTVIAAVLLIALLIGVVAWRVMQKQRTLKLKQRFGPEYDLTVSELGSRVKAEAELTSREKRVAGLTVVPLTPADAVRFTQAWSALQGRFIDNPKGVVLDADHLVRELMAKRGYPMGDFEHRAADISVDYPGVWPLIVRPRKSPLAMNAVKRTRKNCERPSSTIALCSTNFSELQRTRRPVRKPTWASQCTHEPSDERRAARSGDDRKLANRATSMPLLF
jgi:hypothetical protein